MRTSIVLFLGLFGFLCASRSTRADSLSVSVGYTDSLRPNGFFPTSLCSGFSPTCQIEQGVALDGGVFRIDNTGADPVSITDITLTLNSTADPKTFALWSNVVIAPGRSATFGQTSQWDFDTSDYGLLGSEAGININGIGGCTTLSVLTAAQQVVCTANFPVISFDENGNPVTIIDSGSILNTGSYDFHYAPGDGNESINWNLASSVADRSATTVPEPGSLALLGLGILGLFSLTWRKS